MLRKEIDLHHARVSKKRHLIKAFAIRHTGARANVDKYLLGLKHIAVNLDRMSVNESCVAADQLYIFHSREPVGNTLI